MNEKPLLLFDMDGTLIILQEKSEYHNYISLMQQMKEIAVSNGIPREEFDDVNRMAHIWNKIRAFAENHEFDETQIKALMRSINVPFTQEESDEHAKSILLSGTISALQELYSEEYSLGMVTNASREAYNRISNSLEFGCFGRYFEYSITRDECDYIKPDPEPINRILSLFGRNDFVYIGDSDHDAQAVKCAGGIFILINTREYDGQTLKTLNPKAVISSLIELKDVLIQL